MGTDFTPARLQALKDRDSNLSGRHGQKPPRLSLAPWHAGGLGIIGGLSRTPDELGNEIREVREADRPAPSGQPCRFPRWTARRFK